MYTDGRDSFANSIFIDITEMAWLKVYYTLKTAMLIDSADCYGYSSGPTMEIKV